MRKTLLLMATILLFASFAFAQDLKKDFAAAVKLVDARNYSEAIERFNAIDAKWKDVPQVKYYLGICYSSLKRRSEAIVAYQEAVRIKPDFYVAFIQLGNELDYENLYDEAIAAYNKAIALEPQNYSAYFEIGIAQTRAGKAADAEKSFRKVVALVPKYSPGHVNLAVSLQSLNRSAEAIVELQEAIRLAGDKDIETQRQLGLAYKSMGKYPEAIATFEKVISLDSKWADGYYGLGTVYFAQKLYDAAIVQLEKAVGLNPSWKEANATLGESFMNIGAIDKAIIYLKTAADMGDDSKNTLYNLGLCYVKERNSINAELAKPSSRKLTPAKRSEMTLQAKDDENAANELVGRLLAIDPIMSKKLGALVNPPKAKGR